MPVEARLQRIWYKAVGRGFPGLLSHVFCCEDHFDIENDMVDYIGYTMNGGKAVAKASVIPLVENPKATVDNSVEPKPLQNDDNAIIIAPSIRSVKNTELSVNETGSSLEASESSKDANVMDSHLSHKGCKNRSRRNTEKHFVMKEDFKDYTRSNRVKEGVLPHKLLTRRKTRFVEISELERLESNRKDISKTNEEESGSKSKPRFHESGVRYCFAPGCSTNSSDHPTKLFVLVPREQSERQLWFNTFNLPISCDNEKYFCCEDHFTILPEMEAVARDKKFRGLVPRSCVQLKAVSKITPLGSAPEVEQGGSCRDRSGSNNCIVPNCNNTWKKCPDKVPIRIPATDQLKKRCYSALANKSTKRSQNLCWEDRFDATELTMYKCSGPPVLEKESFLPRSRPINEITERTDKITEVQDKVTEMPMTRRRYHCFVPNCKSHSDVGVKKLFLKVPLDEQVQKGWFEAVGRRFNGILENLWCCEDHFDEEDIVNYNSYNFKLVVVKKGIFPRRCVSDEAHPLEPSMKKPRIE